MWYLCKIHMQRLLYMHFQSEISYPIAANILNSVVAPKKTPITLQ